MAKQIEVMPEEMYNPVPDTPIEIGGAVLYYRQMGASQHGLLTQCIIEAARMSLPNTLNDSEVFERAFEILARRQKDKSEEEKQHQVNNLMGQMILAPKATLYLHQLISEVFFKITTPWNLSDHYKTLMLSFFITCYGKSLGAGIEAMNKNRVDAIT